MLFTSTVFLFGFLPLTLLMHVVLPNRSRNVFLLLSSLFFYAWGEAFHAVILLVSIGVNYAMTRGMTAIPPGGRKRAWLWTTVGLNLALLGWFKYANFIVNNINGMMRFFDVPAIHLEPVHLPIGISFFTFQALSYVVDAYYGRVAVQNRLADLALYIGLFPQLIAGPIVRYRDIAGEIAARRVDVGRFAYGVRRFIVGMGKKMILANPMGEVADTVFALSPEQWTAPMAWLGIACYTLQIYFDFSGYSDMAIGLGRMLGFTFKENFDYPYASTSMRAFWRRWHISLSSWFRDYLYLPLGGSHGSPLRTVLNLWVVFLLCGLWHGPSWNFVIWGGLHGCFLSIERTGFDRLRQRVWRPFRHLYVLSVVMVAWVFFRLETLPEALTFIGVMAGLGDGKAPPQMTFDLIDLEHRLVFVAAVLACVSWRPAGKGLSSLLSRLEAPFMKKSTKRLRPWLSTGGQLVNVAVLMAILILSIMHIAVGTYNPFIYFRF